MIDLIRKAMVLKESDYSEFMLTDPAKVHYVHGQVKILDYVIEQNLIPGEMYDELLKIYRKSFQEYNKLMPNDKTKQILKTEVLGACDVLAWMLDIDEEKHEENIKSYLQDI